MEIRCIILGILLSYSCPLVFSQQLLLPVKSQGKWGYCDTLGTIQIPLQYELAGLFGSNGLAPVKMNASSYLIDQKGEIITRDLCREIMILNKDVYACYNGTNWKLHGPNFTSNLPYDIKAIERILFSPSWIIHTNSGAGLINNQAQEVIPPIYDLISEASSPGYYLLQKDSLVGVADNEGKVIVPVQYFFTDFKDPGIIIYNTAEKLGILSLNGLIKTDTTYNQVRTNQFDPFVLLYDEKKTIAFHIETGKKFVCDSTTFLDFFDEDYLMIFLPDGLNLLDKNMRLVFSEQFQTIRREDDGFVVSKNNLFGYTDINGKLIHPLRYQFITRFVEKTAITAIGNTRGAIHVSGTVLAEPEYKKAEVYSLTAKMYGDNGVTTVEFEEDGKIISKNTYGNVMTVKLGGFRDVRKPTQTSDAVIPSVWYFYPETQKWGLNSPTGEILILPMFDRVQRLNTNYSKVAIKAESAVAISNYTLLTGFKWGLVNHQTGEIIYNTQYLDIREDTLAHSFIIVDFQLGHFIKDTSSKVLYGPFSWIGKPNGNVRPVAIGGKLKRCTDDTLHRAVTSFSDFINVQMSPDIFSNKNRITSTGDLIIENATFFSLWNAPTQGIYSIKYDFISEFTNNFARFGMKNQTFGVMDKNMDTIVAPAYTHIEILPSDNSVFFLKYKKREAYGFIKSNGSWAFEKKFDHDGYFSDGMGYMGNNDRGMGVYVDTIGNIHEIENLKRAGHFSEGMAAIKQGRSWVYIDKNFQRIIDEKTWNWLGQFHSGVAPIKTQNKYHYINQYGTWAFEGTFDKADAFNHVGGAIVKKKEKFGVINTAGAYIIKPKYARIVYKPNDSLYYCYTNNGQILMNTNGLPLMKNKIQFMKPFVDGYAWTNLTNGKTVVLKKDGTITEPPKDTRIQSVQGEFAVIYPPEGKVKLADAQLNVLPVNGNISNYKHGRNGFIFGKLQRKGWVALDERGTIQFELKGTPISGFNEGYAIVLMNDGRKMYINKNGEQSFGIFFKSAEPFRNGFARICTEKGWGVIDVSGNYIVMPKYKSIGKFSEGFATVKLESLITISNDKDIPLVDGEYDSVNLESFGFFRVESADRVGWISKTGRVVWNPVR